jgi:galactosyl transferase GMA12/MNN10 family
MKFAVVSMATDTMRELRDISFPNKEAYCRRHGYKWIGETKTRDASRPPAWSKILILADLCVSRSVDWVFWTDADSVIVRPDWKMETLADDSADLVVARDANGINTGVFLMRMGGMTLNFLLDSYALTQYTYHRWWDQAAIRHTLDTGWPFRVKFADKKLINAYPDDFCAGHSAVIHVPNTPRWPDRAGELRRRLPLEVVQTRVESKPPEFVSR